MAALQVNAGLLLHGPPGTGKSFFARAIGSVWKRSNPELRIRLIRGPELFSEFVGKTEEAVRSVFDGALKNLDEFDLGTEELA